MSIAANQGLVARGTPWQLQKPSHCLQCHFERDPLLLDPSVAGVSWIGQSVIDLALMRSKSARCSAAAGCQLSLVVSLAMFEPFAVLS